MDEASSSAVINYRVRRDAAGWRLDRGQALLGLFAEASEAVTEACRAAKSDADCGRVAIVNAETTPQELHCYVPPQEAAARATGLSAWPRPAANR